MNETVKEQITESVTARVPKEMREAFERLAIERHMTSSQVIREAFREYLAKPENRTPAQLALPISKDEAA